MDIRVAVVVLPAAGSGMGEAGAFKREEVGSLHLYHCNVVAGYAVTFRCDSISSAVVPADKCTVKDAKNLELALRACGSILILRVMNMCEFHQFAEALSLSKEIVDLKLQLNMCLRECFFDGVYANADIPENMPFDNLNAFLSSSSASVLETIACMSSGHVQGSAMMTKATATSSKASFITPKRSSSSTSRRLNYSNVVCIYCDTPGTFEPVNIHVHPYVPVTMDNKVLFLCVPCRTNWLSYRQQAAELQQLVLPGEFNEEVCCVCSDSPSRLVLCSTCPRSYCSPCLSKLLTQKQSADMSTNENWQCLCCVHSEKDFRSYTSSLNLSISSQKSVPPLYDLLPPSAFSSTTLPAPCPTAASTSKETVFLSSTSTTILKSGIPDNSHKKNSKRQRCTPVKNADYTTLESEDEEKEVEEIEVKDKEKVEEENSKRHRPSKKKHAKDSERAVRSPHIPNIDPNKTKVGENVISMCTISPLEQNLPPVSTDLDEVYYFSQYIETVILKAVQEQEQGGEEGDFTTEDFCFLCKDGGDLIECDHGRKGVSKCKGVKNCKKVYHEYCLGYVIPDEQKVWTCLRHTCAMCATADITYQCQSCPLSCCRKCFLTWNCRSKFAQFAEMHESKDPTEGPQISVSASSGICSSRKRKGGRRCYRKKEKAPVVGVKVTPITCGTCLRMFHQSFERQLLSPETCNIGSLRNVAELLVPETPVPSLTGSSIALSVPGMTVTPPTADQC